MRGARLAAILAATLLVATGTVAAASEAQRVTDPDGLGPEKGAVQLSVRSQRLFRELLQIWFLREGGDENNASDLAKFERKQRFGRPSMLASQPRVFALKPGRYRLYAHLVGCAGLPPVGQICVAGKNHPEPLPTRRYDGDVAAFTVEAGKLTLAGEYILEYPRGSIEVDDSRAEVRWRPMPSPVPQAFANMPTGPAPETPARFRSNVHCDSLHTGFVKPDLLPFEC